MHSMQLGEYLSELAFSSSFKRLRSLSIFTVFQNNRIQETTEMGNLLWYSPVNLPFVSAFKLTLSSQLIK